MDHAVKDSLALFLPAQADLPGQARVAIDNRLRAGERLRVDFTAGKAPAILVSADQGIDEVSAGANIRIVASFGTSPLSPASRSAR